MSDPVALPLVVTVSPAFAGRWPSPRVQHLIRDIEGIPFQQVYDEDRPRVTVLRALMRDFPDYDVTALWLHSFDVEIEPVLEDPTNGSSPTPAPAFDGSGASGPTT